MTRSPTAADINPDDFCHSGTRRILHLASAPIVPIVIGAGSDGHVYVWNVADRTLVVDFPTTPDSGGTSVALTHDGRTCLVGTYYAWGVAAVDAHAPSPPTVCRRRDHQASEGLRSRLG